MEKIAELLRDIKIPNMVRIRQNFFAPQIEDTASAVQQAISEANVLSRIAPGDRVAIAVGSRGVADIPILVREVVRAVKSAGGVPFIVPAMGSHGGATAQGQAEVLEHLGVTEASTGAPIQSSMDVVQLGQLPNGLPVYADKNAYHADKVIVINRIKPHTAFTGPYESGLMKMMTIGLGKRKGADSAHSYGFGHMADHVPQMARIVLSKVPIIFGLASVENAYDRPAKIVAVPAEQIEHVEPGLLMEAKSLMPRILFDQIDVLVVDEVGKDISGSGMDPNITGRFPTPFIQGKGPAISRIAILSLTEKTDGNANGIGLADIITRKVYDSIDWEKGYFNAFTSTVLQSVKVPMFLSTDKLAVQAAIKTCNAFDVDQVRLVRIKNTLELKEIWVSESMLSEAVQNEQIEVLTNPMPMDFSDSYLN
ncbi:nickel-dependent lactate racemase [Alicyclobacillus tolerans]|uniref:lactate racemase domain-containing protein n=1 Tax=Alicyclobacillus tolerans TaxID=90970 RepID=UPI001F4494E7|nr:lactate racemase domain-containing protein [Alicyclobacillus tolerans]MCF8566845.1 nickel-dependent lactate racemase [Alicyclobacillus tolerans]